jgi:hypothetical protein
LSVRAALAGEVEHRQASLRQLRNAQYAAMSEIVCSGAEYQALLEQHTAAWQRLRTVKTALKAVQAGLHGQMPQRVADEALRSEPMEVRAGFPIDPNLVGAWSDAMAALETDADAPLPDRVGR